MLYNIGKIWEGTDKMRRRRLSYETFVLLCDKQLRRDRPAFEEKDYRKCMKDNMDVIDEEYDRALRDSDFIYHLNVAVSNLALLI